jgi:hypothetical protein
MGFAPLNPSLYQRELIDCDGSERNGPARAAARAGPPVVGSVPIEAFGAVVCSRIATGSSSDPDG